MSNGEGRIWRIAGQEIGKLERFKSEYQMEAFLMGNPGLIGCGSEDWDEPLRLKQQRPTKKGKGGRGRIDLIGLALEEDDSQILKVFELKNDTAEKTSNS